MQRAHSQLFCSLNRISLPVELTVRCLVNDTSLAESVFGLLLSTWRASRSSIRPLIAATCQSSSKHMPQMPSPDLNC